jgi:hypothetical protein
MEMMDEVWELLRRALTPDPEITYICSLSFTKPSPEIFPEAEYSDKEVIIYPGISPHVMTETPDHALLLLKNIRRRRFELHRLYYHDGSVEVIFRGSFTKALETINHEIAKYRPELLGRIKPCEHKPPHVDRAECPILHNRVLRILRTVNEIDREILEVKGMIRMHEERLSRLLEKKMRLKRELENLA